MTRDWVSWHVAYDDPNSSLSHRLVIVQQMIRDALDAAPAGPIRLLSLCSGDARDVVGACHGHPRARDVVGALVELDPTLAHRAQIAIGEAGLSLDVRCGDAADSKGFADAIPADVLVLVGIFGNISDEDVAGLIAAAPSMCAAGGTIIWSRHRRAPDLTPKIRRWFDRAGFESVDFRSPGADSFAIGGERLAVVSPACEIPMPLFAFRDDLW